MAMKRLLYVVAALLLLATARPHAIEISGMQPGPNRELLAQSLRRALPPNVEVRVVVVDREIGALTPPAARTP